MSRIVLVNITRWDNSDFESIEPMSRPTSDIAAKGITKSTEWEEWTTINQTKYEMSISMHVNNQKLEIATIEI